MRLGFLVAELFMALAVIFLVGSTVGHVTNFPTPTPTPTMTPTPTPTPVIQVCGLEPTLKEYKYNNVQNSAGLRANPPDTTAVNALKAEIQKDFATNTRIAGLVEVYGGGNTVGDGQNLAKGVIVVLKAAGGSFTKKTIYQPFFNTSLSPNSMYFDVFYYQQATVCS